MSLYEEETEVTDRNFRLLCIVLCLGFLVGAFLCALVDDTPDVWLFASLLGASGVFAVLRP